MTDRFDYIEDQKSGEKKTVPEPEKDKINFPLLASYDFNSGGPRKGVSEDQNLYKTAQIFETRGEQMASIISRISALLLRAALGIALIYILLYGRTFNCMGGRYHFR